MFNSNQNPKLMKNLKTTLIILFVLCVFNPSNAQENSGFDIQNRNADGNYSASARAETSGITYTYNNGWSPSSPLSAATSLDDIIIESGTANITANTSCNILTVDPGAAIVIDSGVTLTTDAINLNSNSQQYSSLISDGTIVGTVTYKRYTSQIGTNDLISAPISGQLFPDFAALNLNLAASGTLRAFAPFDTSSGAYQNYDVLSNETTSIDAGMGYRAATTDGSALTFTGVARTDDVLDVVISDDTASGAWNLIGNPYPSYLDFDAFFALNKSQLNNTSYQAIYGYDGDLSNGWTVWNQATADSPAIVELIAPGQAFFVKAKSGGGLIDFTTAMRCTGSSDDFILGRASSSAHHGFIRLNSSSGSLEYSTDFYFNSNATQGFDPGYDSALYSAIPPAFSLYSHLVEGNSGTPFGVQSFDPDSMYNVVVPLGVNVNQGQETTFHILETDMPDDINIYLEDTANNSFTLLNTSDYVFTPNDNLTGTGRFYLRFSTTALSVVQSDFETIVIQADNKNKTININGQLHSETNTKLYDVNGRVILTDVLSANTSKQVIDVSHLSAGIYIIELNSNTSQRRVEKLIIN